MTQLEPSHVDSLSQVKARTVHVQATACVESAGDTSARLSGLILCVTVADTPPRTHRLLRMWFAQQIPDVTLLQIVSPTSHTVQTLGNILWARSIASATTESPGLARKIAGSPLAPHLWSPQQRYPHGLLQRRRIISSVVAPVGQPRLFDT